MKFFIALAIAIPSLFCFFLTKDLYQQRRCVVENQPLTSEVIKGMHSSGCVVVRTGGLLGSGGRISIPKDTTVVIDGKEYYPAEFAAIDEYKEKGTLCSPSKPLGVGELEFY